MHRVRFFLLLGAIPVTAAHAQLRALAGGLAVGYAAVSTVAIAKVVDRRQVARTGDSLRASVHTQGRGFEITGRATMISKDSIALRSGDATMAFAVNDASALRVYSEDETMWAKGWLIGLVSGIGVGAIGAYLLESQCPVCPDRGAGIVIASASGAVAGPVFGAAIGANAHNAYWRSVDRLVTSDEKPRVGIAPLIGPRTLGARVQFTVR